MRRFLNLLSNSTNCDTQQVRGKKRAARNAHLSPQNGPRKETKEQTEGRSGHNVRRRRRPLRASSCRPFVSVQSREKHVKFVRCHTAAAFERKERVRAATNSCQPARRTTKKAYCVPAQNRSLRLGFAPSKLPRVTIIGIY